MPGPRTGMIWERVRVRVLFDLTPSAYLVHPVQFKLIHGARETPELVALSGQMSGQGLSFTNSFPL
jgi:hypothetical protein